MRTLNLEQTTLDDCIQQSQEDRILITRDGMPVAVVVGVSGLDQEQAELGSDHDFWKLITERRRQPTLSRTELDQKCNGL